mmetsp:Transcript_7898/g.22383  ORF Transcript_7898/g.22383 Transcript_7898/m.22383 type:complete len:533 (-) Transcript_7898:152-1750(-)
MASKGKMYQDRPFEVELRARLFRIESKLDQLAGTAHVHSQVHTWVNSESDPFAVAPEAGDYQEEIASSAYAGSPRTEGMEEDQGNPSCQGSRVRSSATAVRPSFISDLGAKNMPPPRVGTQGRRVTQNLMEQMEKDSRFGVIQRRSSWLDAVWSFLSDPDSSQAAYAYNILMNPCIAISVLVPFLQHGDSPFLNSVIGPAVEMTVEVLFGIEILLRFAVCPNYRAFATSIYNLIDIVVVLPLVLRCAPGFAVSPPRNDIDWLYFVLLGVVPVLRLLKLLRRFEKFHLVLRAFGEAFEALPVLLYCLAIMALFFAAFLYLVEPRDNLEFLPEALWLTLVTMTTVGYGDYSPISRDGRIVTIALMICSSLYMTIPLGIVGSAFTRVWEDRDRTLVIKRTRHKLHQWGYRAEDIPDLFEMFDVSGTGELNYREFRRMLCLMKVGLRESQVHKLFEVFDHDGSGAVDENEFIAQIFPSEFYEIFSPACKRNSVLNPPRPPQLHKTASLWRLSLFGWEEKAEAQPEEPGPEREEPAG